MKNGRKNSEQTPEKALKIESKQVRLGPASIYYETVGAGKPLILVHGLSGSTRWWSKNIRPLAEKFRLYIVDLIGFGQSRSQSGFVLDEAALYLKRWLDRLEIEQASLIGHSMGGSIVADLAADFPGRIERLVLVDAVGIPFDRNLPQQALGMVQALQYVPLDLMHVVISGTFRAGLIKTMRLGHELRSRDLTAKLACISAPTLVLWGEQDTIVPLKLGEKLNASLPDSQLVVIKGAGHVPMWEKPEPFNRAVLDFLLAPQPASLAKERT